MKNLEEVLKFLKGYALIVVGLLAVLVAANAGSQWGITVATLGWQITIASIGAMLIAFNFWFIIKGRSEEEKALNKDYDIDIHSPKQGDRVSSPITIRGTLKRRPKGIVLYTFEYNHSNQHYYPKSEFNYQTGTNDWYCSLNIGGGDDKQRSIVIAAVGKFGKYFIDYYQKVANDTGGRYFIGVKQLPPGIVKKKEVTIWLNKPIP